jgi:hypothetical protein
VAREQFEQIQARVGGTFTTDAYPGLAGSLTSPEGRPTPEEFVGSDCAGQRIWLHPSPTPHNTAACVVVQQWRKAPYKVHLAGMRLVHQIPADQGLLSAVSTDGAPTSVPSPHTLRVYYDAPMVLSAARVQEPTPGGGDMLMKFNGTAAGHPATVALDTMASHCFVSAAWAARAGVEVVPTDDKVLLAAGAPHQIQGTCSVRLRLGAWHGRVRAFVMPLQECHEVLLGDDWLAENGATLCFQRRQVTVRCGNRVVTVPCRDAPGRTEEGRRQTRAGRRPRRRTPTPPPEKATQLTAVQFLRAARKGATTFLALIQCAAAVDAAAQAGAAVDAARGGGPAVDAPPLPPSEAAPSADACSLQTLLDVSGRVPP